jgi:hypothetical protein
MNGLHLTAAQVASLRAHLARADETASRCTRLANDPAVSLAEYEREARVDHLALAGLAGYLEAVLDIAEGADQ